MTALAGLGSGQGADGVRALAHGGRGRAGRRVGRHRLPGPARLPAGLRGDHRAGAGGRRRARLRRLPGRVRAGHRPGRPGRGADQRAAQAWFNGCCWTASTPACATPGRSSRLSHHEPAERDDFFATLPARRNADALIVASFALTAAERERLSSIGMPLVYVNQRVDGAPSVSIDDAEATADRDPAPGQPRPPLAGLRPGRQQGRLHLQRAGPAGRLPRRAGRPRCEPGRPAGAPGRRGRRRGVRRRQLLSSPTVRRR